MGLAGIAVGAIICGWRMGDPSWADSFWIAVALVIVAGTARLEQEP